MGRYIALLLLMLNVYAGFSLINDGLFHPDVVHLAQSVEKTYATGILQPAHKGRYGSVIVASIIYLPFFLLGHNADFAVRFSGVLFHALSVVMLFYFVRILLKETLPAFFAALFLSFTPFYLSPNTYGKEHGMSLFFFLLSLYALSRGVQGKSYMLVALSSFLLAFSISIKESMIVGVPLFYLLFFSPAVTVSPLRVVISRDKINVTTACAVFVPFLLTMVFLGIWYLGDEIHRALFIKDYSSTYFVGYAHFLKNQYALYDLALSIPAVLFLVAGIGLIMMVKRRESFLALFLVCWSALGLYFANTSTYTARFLDIPIIPLYVFAGYALHSIYKRFKWLAAAIVLYSVMHMTQVAMPLLMFRHEFNGPKQFALYVQKKRKLMQLSSQSITELLLNIMASVKWRIPPLIILAQCPGL